ncbi:ArgE/DapE family deacylase [Peptococcus simiae]|uniref:ArgE/DapE family deacylase n=1 Tax=Peptococcus simiae TaxID=1643805 RepID=UPI00397FCB9F
MDKYLAILQQLIQIKSVNDHEEEVAKYIADLFKGYDNVETELISSFPGRSNVLVKVKGTEKGKILAFSGHLDVVEPGEGWTYPPFEGTVVGNKMYGLGTCDMKAGVAASLYALMDILEAGTPFAGELWFIGTVGEEIGMQGAKDLVDGGHLEGVDAILISEPTKRNGENQAIFASKGSIMYTIQAEGRAAHSSMPELGINALTTLADFIRRVQDQFDAVTADPKLQNPNLGSTLNVFSVIEGGRQVNSVPDKVVLRGNTRTVPEFSTDPSIGIFEAAIAKNNQDPDRATLSLNLDQVLDPAEAATDNLLIQALKRAASDKNVRLRPLIGACELARYIHLSADIQLVVYGPGLTEKAHTVDEYIELDEYLDTIRIFKDLALDFLSR